MSWTKARTEKFKELYADNLSFSRIADELGGFSHCRDGGRNACIGKARRLKLPEREYSEGTERVTQTPARRAKPAPETRKRLTDGSLPAAVIPVPEVHTNAHLCSIFDLTNETCRYPCWEDGASFAEKFYCGTPTADLYAGKPYCGFHTGFVRGQRQEPKERPYRFGKFGEAA